MIGSKQFIVSAMVIGAALLSSGCTKELPQHNFGPRSETGTLIRADVSLIRRGSHVLIVQGQKKFYVESRTKNLSDFEGRIVHVEGSLEPNNDTEDLPVLVAERVDGPTENEDLRRFEVPALNIRLGIPESWHGSIAGGTAAFSLAGETDPLMAVRQMSGSSLPSGNVMFIKNRRTSRIDAPSGGTDVFILDKDTVLQIHFDAATQTQLKTKEEADIVAAQFERVLSTISFISDREVTAPVTGSGGGTVCGGPAGLVCDSGYFCNITDFEQRIGACKKR